MGKQTYIILLAGVLLFNFHSLGQLPSEQELFNYDNNEFHFVRPQDPPNPQYPFLIVAIKKTIRPYPKKNREFGGRQRQIADSLWKNKNFNIIEQDSHLFMSVTNFDSSKALIFVQGINRKNAGQYEYRIMENNVSNNNWKPFVEFYNGTFMSGYGEKDSEMATLGYIGTDWDQYLTIDVREKKTTKIISTATVLWVTHPPKVIATFAPNEFNRFLALFKIRSQVESFFTPDIPREDSLLVIRKEFTSTENTLIFYLDDLIKKKLVEYKLEGPNVNSEWKSNDLDFNLIWLKDLSPGKYKLLIRYATQRHNITTYDFEIKPEWQQTTWFKIILGSLIAAFFGFIIAIIRIRRQKEKILREQIKKEKTEIELKSIRSQLNPHFVYNSLSSIQNLVNKKDIDNANKYLSQFSKLMRETLSTSDKKFNSIANEIRIIETYLALEKLRFNFSYTITQSEGIDPETTEIPSMLLQPLVENAVKHGIEPLKEKGSIGIHFTKNNQDLSISIFDNGRGYAENKGNGFGLKLTRERIDMLNRTLDAQSIQLFIDSKMQQGTRIDIIFKKWLA